jgi:hypothetical protein
MTSAVWSCSVLSLCCTKHGPASWCHPVGSYHYCSHVQEWSAGPTLHSRVALLRHACLAGALVTHERALKTRESTCVPRVAKSFFIPVVHSPPGVVGHVAASELPSQEGRAWSHGTHGSTGAHIVKEARSKADGHVTALELTSASRRCLGPWDTWQHQSSPQHRGKVRGHGTCGGAGAYLCREVWTRGSTGAHLSER